MPIATRDKLRLHERDNRQFAYDNGRWFLHIGDTGYRYVTQSEPKWRQYIDQAARMGATKIRTWFCQGRSDVQILFSEDRSRLNQPYWQEIDRRLKYTCRTAEAPRDKTSRLELRKVSLRRLLTVRPFCLSRKDSLKPLACAFVLTNSYGEDIVEALSCTEYGGRRMEFAAV